VRADDDGNFAQIGWGTFDFCGQSVYRLRGEVSIKLAEPFASIGMTLCVRAGLCGRLTLLVTDLPRSQEPMDVVVLTTGSPGDNLLPSSSLSGVFRTRSVLLLGFNSS
jgi:hypothetical protein